MSFFQELKRRNVFRVAVAYVIIAWLILQVGEVLAPALRLPEWTNSALAFFLILGFPVAVFFAWAFELTPDGLRKEKDVDRSRSITQTTGRKLDFTIIALLVLALTYFAADKFIFQARTDEAPATASGSMAGETVPTIAVLPLADMSPEGDHEYFSDGLTEELLNILAKIQELQVAGRTSSFAFKGQNEDLREIGRKLNVRHILEGSVRKDEARNRVRITLQLIDADSGFHLWSETYDRDLDDIFRIQEEVAHQVADALRITLLGEDEQRLDQIASTGVDVYDLYLKGRDETRKGGFVNLERAEDYYQQALTLDPDYTPARLGLINNWGRMAATGAIAVDDAVARGLPMLEGVLEADPNNATALALMAGYVGNGLGDREAADRYYRRSLELEPRNALTLRDYGGLLYAGREVERGMALIDAALEIEPYDIEMLFAACQVAAHQRLREKALAHCRRVQELAPDGPQGFYGEALVHLYEGDMPRTLLFYRRALERDPEDFEMIAAMALFWIALGELEEAERWLERAEVVGAGQPVPIFTRVLFLELNERHGEAGRLAAEALARNMDDRHGTQLFFRRAVAQHALRTGDPELGLATYRELIPWAFEPGLAPEATALEWADDLLFIAALVKAQDPLSAQPDVLVDFVEQHASDYHPASGQNTLPYRLAAVQALRGNPAEALEHLRDYGDYMVLPYWRNDVPNNPAFYTMRDNAEFRAFVREVEAKAERQRADALALLEVGP